MGIVAVRVTLADSSVLPVDEQLGVLVAGDLASRVDGLALRFVDRRQSLVAFASDAPSISGRDDMLVLAQLRPPLELRACGPTAMRRRY
jgi:hypothetical protein